MVSNKKLANAFGGRTARACDNCLRKRARWFCPADDAFLCQACDASVHSANSLARRHERVRLKTSSWKTSEDDSPLGNFAPSWHQGFTRKARTPRHGGPSPSIFKKPKSEEPTRNSHPLVPDELGSGGETSNEENEDDQLLYRVPVFDPLPSSRLSPPVCSGFQTQQWNNLNVGAAPAAKDAKTSTDANGFHGFLPSETELAEFAADVENLWGNGFDEESFDMESLGLMDCKEKDSEEGCIGKGRVKVEDEEDTGGAGAAMGNHGDTEIDVERDAETFELNFDYNSIANYEEEENKVEGRATMMMENEDETVDAKKTTKKILLKLDYDGVVTAWNDQRSPWTTGDRPELDPADDCWPYCMGNCGTFHHQDHGNVMGVIGGQNMVAVPMTMVVDRGREARVSRYREKRRTRLFSKKIRYEVRKLNAEKRPRMKGRFIKRASCLAGAATFPLLNK
ncbi:hypothetical protein U1Q18_002320 [Sarracenia purpurea var. burkii]